MSADRKFPCCVHCEDARGDHVEHGGTVEKDGHDVACDTCLYDAEVDRRVAKALHRAADDWQQGQWADAPRRKDRTQERIANGQYVTDWLRARADRLGDVPSTTTDPVWIAAEALRQAADAVKRVRESPGLPPGVKSHPVAEHFETWLRDRADRLYPVPVVPVQEGRCGQRAGLTTRYCELPQGHDDWHVSGNHRWDRSQDSVRDGG